MSDNLNVTIVGGGFGGIKTALELAKNPSNRITLLSDRDYFQYYPALFSTATGHDSRESFVPLGAIFAAHKNVTIIRDSIQSIDTSARLLKGDSAYHYDTAVLALGSVTTYFGIDGLDTFAYGIKSQAEILKLQEHLWEEMSDGSDDEKHYVIIGAGPTGVELAGALGQYILTLRKQFGIRKKRVTINLIEAAPRVLPRLSEKTSAKALKHLRGLGVHVEVNKKVERQTAQELIVNGRPLATQTVIWTSGVTNAPFFKQNAEQLKLNERGKVVVDSYMMAAPNVYVIGDNADTPYAGLAQTALHDAMFVAKHLKGREKRYAVKLPPCVVPIGENWALFEWGRVRFYGRPAAIMRSLADVIGYHDVLPIGWAFKAWRAQSKKQLRMPATLNTDN
ncbi:FAD-dependent oxidoreductase [Candidatus Saccharibacteria bacterium]|nr:FAD-dependent oxidoreductase [Candidatus Saccharibacteria bacterium]